MSSGKIRSKDLSYDASLPPFLQRLKNQHAGSGDADRHERAIARPRRTAAKEDGEDDPVILDENGDQISKKELEDLTATAETGTKPSATIASSEGRPADQRVTDGRASTKRKAAKIVGDENTNDAQRQQSVSASSSGTGTSKSTKKTKKAKIVKLAFDDGEEEG